MKIKIVPIFKVRIVYKSGYFHDLKVYSFSLNNNRYEWQHVSDRNKPILLGVDEIAAVYQIGYTFGLRWEK